MRVPLVADGPSDSLLILLQWPEDPGLTDEIRRRFPHLSVNYFCVQSASKQLREEAESAPSGTRPENYIFDELLNPSRVDFDAETSRARDRLKELLHQCGILLTLFLLPPSADDAPHLKLVHVLSAGVDTLVRHPVFHDSKIDFTTSSGIHGVPIGEWVMMNVLAFRRKLLYARELQKSHQWSPNRSLFENAADLYGRKVGILGYGSIGRHVGRLFAALGCTVLAYTATPRPDGESRRDRGYIIPGTGDPDGSIPAEWFSGTDRQSLHTFIGQGLDVLVLAVPLTPSTRNLISVPEFQVLEKSTSPPGKCFLVNIARGPIVDQPALVEALNENQLAGAALDVTDPEPLPATDPLWNAKNLTVTPHISALGPDYQSRAFEILMVNLKRRERGEKLLNLVNRKQGY